MFYSWQTPNPVNAIVFTTYTFKLINNCIYLLVWYSVSKYVYTERRLNQDSYYILCGRKAIIKRLEREEVPNRRLVQKASLKIHESFTHSNIGNVEQKNGWPKVLDSMDYHRATLICMVRITWQEVTCNLSTLSRPNTYQSGLPSFSWQSLHAEELNTKWPTLTILELLQNGDPVYS